MFGFRLVRVFGVGGSNGTICGSIKSKMAADGHLGMTAGAVPCNPCVNWAFLFTYRAELAAWCVGFERSINVVS